LLTNPILLDGERRQGGGREDGESLLPFSLGGREGGGKRTREGEWERKERSGKKEPTPTMSHP